jgi:hypothetical protein
MSETNSRASNVVVIGAGSTLTAEPDSALATTAADELLLQPDQVKASLHAYQQHHEPRA